MSVVYIFMRSSESPYRDLIYPDRLVTGTSVAEIRRRGKGKMACNGGRGTEEQHGIEYTSYH